MLIVTTRLSFRTQPSCFRLTLVVNPRFLFRSIRLPQACPLACNLSAALETKRPCCNWRLSWNRRVHGRKGSPWFTFDWLKSHVLCERGSNDMDDYQI